MHSDDKVRAVFALRGQSAIHREISVSVGRRTSVEILERTAEPKG